MFWLIVIVGFLCFLLCWLLIAPVEVEVNTVSAYAELRWLSIGYVRICYEEEWWLHIGVFFYRTTIPFSKMKKRTPKVTAATVDDSRKRNVKTTLTVKKVIQMVGTLRVKEWQLAIDTGAFDRNARLYPLNFLPGTYGHLHINFQGQNSLLVRVRARTWKIIYAFLK